MHRDEERGGDGAGALTLDEAAGMVDGRVLGNGSREVRSAAPLETAGPGDLGLLADRRYLDRVPGSGAEALLVSQALAGNLPEEGPPALVVEDAHRALRTLLQHWYPPEKPREGIHPTAVVAEDAELASDVHVGPYAVVEEGAHIGEGTELEAHVVVGRGVRVGRDCRLHPHVVLYPGALLGDRVEVHAGARLAVDGFGYVFEDGAHRKVPQVGTCVIEDDVEIGANTCMDRGSIGETRVGAGTKVDNLVHLGHNVHVGRQGFVTAQVGVAGSTRVGDGVLLGGQAGLAGHLTVGDGARVGAQAGIIGDIPPGKTVSGYPARDHREYLRGMGMVFKLPELAQQVRRVEARLAELEGAKVGPDGD